MSGSPYLVVGLSENTSYTFYVVANDAAGNSSAASNTVNITTLATPTCNDGIQNGDETGVDCGGSFCPVCPPSDTILNQGFFETGWDNWQDGGSDCARLASSFSYEGNYSIQIRDNSGTASAMILSNINTTPYSQVIIDFYFYVSSMENGEDFWVRYYNGSTWTTVATYVSGSNINNNTFYNATVTLTSAQYAFVSNAGFSFQCDASANNDYIYIDQVTITGTNSSRGEENNLVALETYRNTENVFEGDILLYPNPIKNGELNVKLAGSLDASFEIVNMLGQTVLSGNSIANPINVNKLQTGVYLIKVNDGEEVVTERFVKE